MSATSDLIALLAAQRRRRVLLEGFFSQDPGAGGFNLPLGMAITCASTGRTSQTSASTLRVGIGANVARGRSVNGAAWGLAVEKAAAMANDKSDASTWAASSVTIAAIAGPSGVTEGARFTDSSAAAAGFANCIASPPDAIGTVYTRSIWVNNNTGAGTQGCLRSNCDVTDLTITYPITSWKRVSVSVATTQTGGSRAFLVAPCNINAAAETGALDVAFPQYERGKYPTSVYPHSALAATRAADVLSLSAPSTIAPSGFFDLSLVVAPHYANTEQGADHNLLYFDANNRLFVQQSTAKLVLRIGGADVASSALTWSRETALRIRARHTPRERVLEVLGATTGNGVASGSAAAAISLPATAYLLGSSTGSEECSSLYAVQFQRAA